MKKLIILILCMTCSSLIAKNILEEATVRKIVEEISNAAKDKDITPMQKYMYEGTVITIDMDLHPDRGEIDMAYDDNFVQLAEMAMKMSTSWDYQNEVVSIDVDPSKNLATVKEKSSLTYTIMGETIHEISTTITIYGVVDGEIKILTTKEKLINSEMLK
ncbi:hypothetical protein [Marinicella sp. W31]|uniref:hypothetical protein n=1 Tax=Marinicella sp. W31 TaxID=3023713 RepID=UPI003757D509